MPKRLDEACRVADVPAKHNVINFKLWKPISPARFVGAALGVPMLMISGYSYLRQHIMRNFATADVQPDIVFESSYSAHARIIV
jgi:hypothetical protein